MVQARKSLRTFVARVRAMFAQWQLMELDAPTLKLFTLHGRQLLERRVNRGLFFRVIHPTYNPLLTRVEATFLRGACYALREFHHDFVAEAVDRVLRGPQMDEYLCRELLKLGALDEDRLREEGYRFMEKYEGMAQGNGDESEDESEEEYSDSD